MARSKRAPAKAKPTPEIPMTLPDDLPAPSTTRNFLPRSRTTSLARSASRSLPGSRGSSRRSSMSNGAVANNTHAPISASVLSGSRPPTPALGGTMPLHSGSVAYSSRYEGQEGLAGPSSIPANDQQHDQAASTSGSMQAWNDLSGPATRGGQWQMGEHIESNVYQSGRPRRFYEPFPSEENNGSEDELGQWGLEPPGGINNNNQSSSSWNQASSSTAQNQPASSSSSFMPPSHAQDGFDQPGQDDFDIFQWASAGEGSWDNNFASSSSTGFAGDEGNGYNEYTQPAHGAMAASSFRSDDQGYLQMPTFTQPQENDFREMSFADQWLPYGSAQSYGSAQETVPGTMNDASMDTSTQTGDRKRKRSPTGDRDQPIAQASTSSNTLSQQRGEAAVLDEDGEVAQQLLHWDALSGGSGSQPRLEDVFLEDPSPQEIRHTVDRKGKGKARAPPSADEETVIDITDSPPLDRSHPIPFSSNPIHSATESIQDAGLTANSNANNAAAKPKLSGDPLSTYTCPICFSPPTNATLTPCGHICCGECLFAAVKTTLQRGGLAALVPGAGLSEARCPVCRATIPGWDGKGGGVVGLKVRAVFSF